MKRKQLKQRNIDNVRTMWSGLRGNKSYLKCQSDPYKQINNAEQKKWEVK